jgi:alkylation response protein AidB-like acyl-CoA dehydrogenase
MKSEGVSVNPIESIDKHYSLNEVEFNNVRVPVENLIGEQDMGWTYAKALLAHERTAIANVADSRKHLNEIVEVAATEMHNGRPLIEDASFQRRLSDVEIELMALEYTELRSLAAMSAGGAPGPESSLLKIKGTEVQQAVQQLKMETAAYYQAVEIPEGDDDPSGHPFGNKARQQFMYGRAATIYGGSNEVQKNIIAKAVLGL